MNQLDELFKTKRKNILSVYFTAGYPYRESVEEIILQLERNGVDMIEIGMPYSDPLADGPVIQETSRIAIENGMTLNNLFIQLKDIRKKTSIPLLLMGYLNPIIQFGFERFCRKASESGIDGLIIPDLPVSEYVRDYKIFTDAHDLRNIFLITPDTSEVRIRQIDDLCPGFIYMVSSSSITGKTGSFGDEQTAYFSRISAMKLKHPIMTGFGIHNSTTLNQVFSFGFGAIIGSAYMRFLNPGKSVDVITREFFKSLK
ncbi:MAG TPA: tryptophan synthase subunit alpha [Bacteroidales bacterium]|nr:tryptophan synthase subunit alpha [Bacteroidales bacterium]